MPGKTIDFFTADSETIFSIDIESDTIEYFVSVTAECGCCGENEFGEPLHGVRSELRELVQPKTEWYVELVDGKLKLK